MKTLTKSLSTKGLLAAGALALSLLAPTPVNASVLSITTGAEAFTQLPGAPTPNNVNDSDGGLLIGGGLPPFLGGGGLPTSNATYSFSLPNTTGTGPANDTYSATGSSSVDGGGGLHASAQATVSLYDPNHFQALYGANASAAWGDRLLLPGSGPDVYMVPTFRVTGSMTNTGDAFTLPAPNPSDPPISGLGAQVLLDTPGTSPASVILTQGGTGTVDTMLTPSFAIQLGVEQFYGISLDVGTQFVPPKLTSGPVDPFVGEALVDFSSTVELISVEFFADAAMSTRLSIAGISSGLGFDYNALQGISSVPEPLTAVLLLTGLAPLLGRRRRLTPDP